MEDLAERAIESASTAGATYSDVRIEKRQYELYVVDSGCLAVNLKSREKSGAGVRVICDGAWGFFSTTDLSTDGVRKAADEAIKLAKTSATAVKDKVVLAPTKVFQDHVESKAKRSFWDVCAEEKIEYCMDMEARLRSDNRIASSSADLAGVGFDRLFVSSEGAHIRFENTIIYCEFRALAVQNGVGASERKYGGGTGGFEVVEKKDMYLMADNVRQGAIESLQAKTCPNLGKTKIVMDPYYLSLVVHEILAHPSEADRILGMEKAWAGSAWWAGWLGKKIGSDYLTVVDDPTIEGSLPFYLYDDEGVKARRKMLVDKGVLKEHIHSRQTAAMLNAEPNAGMRAMSYEFFPLIRMSNTFIESGDWTFDEMVKDTKEGIYVRGSGIPSIDEKRIGWSIDPLKAYLIRKGEIREVVRGARVMGTAPDFFNSIDAAAKDRTILPLPVCAKGDPSQTGICVGNGGPHIRGEATVYTVRG